MNESAHTQPSEATLERARNLAHQALLDRLEGCDAALLNDEVKLRPCLEELVGDTLRHAKLALQPADHERVTSRLLADIGGMGALAPLILDGDITDILVNGPDEIWIDKGGRLQRTGLRFDDEVQLRRFLDRIVETCGRSISFRSPMVDARLPDGSRLHAVIPPVSQSGIVISIRCFRVRSPSRQALLESGFVSPAMLDCLETAVRDGRNIVIAGGAGTGKTTLLNVLSRFIPDTQRVVTVEDSAELNLEHGHVVRLEARAPNADDIGKVGIRDLLKTALRMRADRLIVGEVRGGEAIDMLQAFSVGHDGGMTTMHANSVADTIRRLETLASMHGLTQDRGSIRQMIGSAVDLVVHLHRSRDGRRRVDTISSVAADSETVVLQELFSTDGRLPASAAGGTPDSQQGARLSAPARTNFGAAGGY